MEAGVSGRCKPIFAPAHPAIGQQCQEQSVVVVARCSMQAAASATACQLAASVWSQAGKLSRSLALLKEKMLMTLGPAAQ